MKKTLQERFWEKVDVKEQDDCWEWKACKKSDGYGLFNISNKNEIASRVSWEIKYGKIEKNLCVLHKCDNPLCVNPHHLFLGTHLDNMMDMCKKGRTHNSKLSIEKVKEIKILLAQHRSPNSIAKKFQISKQLINSIKQKKIWAHVKIE